MSSEEGKTNWGKFHPITEEAYLNHGIGAEFQSPLFIKTQSELNELDLNKFKNRIMSKPKDEKLCLKTLNKVLEMIQESWPSNLQSEYMYGMTQGYSSIIMLIQSKALVEFEKLAKESESD